MKNVQLNKLGILQKHKSNNWKTEQMDTSICNENILILIISNSKWNTVKMNKNFKIYDQQIEINTVKKKTV